MLLISTYDDAAKLYAPPMTAHTVEQAKRSLRISFLKQFGDTDKELLDDFKFFVVGEMSEETGEIKPCHIEFFISSSDGAAEKGLGLK